MMKAKQQGDGSLKCIQVGRRGYQGMFSFQKGVTFGSLHPVQLSEILLAFETAAAGTRFASKAPTAGPRGASSSPSPRQQSTPRVTARREWGRKIGR